MFFYLNSHDDLLSQLRYTAQNFDKVASVFQENSLNIPSTTQ